MPDALQSETSEAMSEALARTRLWTLSGRRYGISTTTREKYAIGPCGGRGRAMAGSGGGPVGACGGGCCVVELANQPVRSVVAVRLHGVASTGWTLTGSSLSIPGGCSSCSSCADPSIEVDYKWGIPMSLAGIAAMRELQCWYADALATGACEMPSNVTNVSRQGVTVQIKDDANAMDMDLTGLPLTQAFIQSVNPGKLVRRSRVLSPDKPRRVG